MNIVLGTAQFGLDYGVANQDGRITNDEVMKIINLSNKHNINTLDTAISYGDSENILGNQKIHKWKIITKLPAVPDNVSDIENYVNENFNNSLKKFKTKNIYALLLHSPIQLFEGKGKRIFNSLNNLKDKGLISKVGISVYSPFELDRILESYDFDIVQFPMNILDCRFLESNILINLKKQGVETYARSIFLQGLLLMKARPLYFNRWNHIWSEWDRWLNLLKISPLEACVRFAISQNNLDNIIIGVDSSTHLTEIINNSKTSLPSLPNWPSNIDNELINPSFWNK